MVSEQTATLQLGAKQRISYAAHMQEKSDEQLMQQYAKGDTQSFEFLLDEQQREKLLAEIGLLPEEQRSTLLLKLETGLKMEQIATVTSVNRETVKSRLRYAVNRLKRNLLE